MSDQIFVSLIAVFGTIGGVFISAWTQREGKKIAALERRVTRYKNEIRARQCEEEIASEWLVELGAATTSLSAKVLLRDRTEQRRGLRPSIGPAEIRDV